MQDAVNSGTLREQAEKCLRLAKCINDPEAIAALRNMALEYQTRAQQLDEQAYDGVPHPKMEPPRQA